MSSEVSVGYQVRRVMVILESRHHIPINQLTQKTKNNDNYHEKKCSAQDCCIKVDGESRHCKEPKEIGGDDSYDLEQVAPSEES